MRYSITYANNFAFRCDSCRTMVLFTNCRISRNAMSNYMNLGAIDVDLGDYKDAKTAYLNSIKIGQYYQTYENLAFLYMVYGNRQDNINFIKNDALKKFPQDAQIWQSLAVIEYKQG